MQINADMLEIMLESMEIMLIHGYLWLKLKN